MKIEILKKIITKLKIQMEIKRFITFLDYITQHLHHKYDILILCVRYESL